MKLFKTTIAILIFNTLFIAKIYSQIKVTSTGTIGLRTLTPDPNYDVHIKGQKLWLDQSWPGIYVTPNPTVGGNPQWIYPGSSNSVWLGGPSNTFAKLYLNGGTYRVSDRRAKENIRPIKSATEKLLKLQGVIYNLKDALNTNEKRDELGFIAQDVIDIVPEVVEYSKADDKYSMVYEGIIPLLVEAFKEQNKIIEDQKVEMEMLKSKVNTDPNSEDSERGKQDLKENKLFQNVPNPFNEATIIGYGLSKKTKEALLLILNLQGTLIKKITISNYGRGEVKIDSGELKPGMYYYTLLVDNKEIDTKKMIVTD